ncbi:Tim44/TimA family putative adaptor protein [uncultured Rhodoblastus sp.]|uniref:Tim44/TimA family putative adaptor protein n=1 Tax=uncultured Rhodoblastus sp. TaxID=543037 RepID=UPI0025E4B91D|nr:Tim44/TimA family putative adaptor protein [uncultured Rhodoblastus sp.]
MQLDPAMIIFAFLAIFVLWKLRSVLGERTGLEGQRDPGPSPIPAPLSPPSANDARWTEFADRGSPVWAGLDDIARAQPDFAPRSFLDGACAAYEMVVQAFSRGDEAALHSLASEEVFNSFKGALEERTRRGETMETTFVGFNSVKLVEARVERPNALIAVRFDSQFVTVTRASNGAVIEGDPTQPSNIVDIWTFARRNDASGPNWTLVATTPAQ